MLLSTAEVQRTWTHWAPCLNFGRYSEGPHLPIYPDGILRRGRERDRAQKDWVFQVWETSHTREFKYTEYSDWKETVQCEETNLLLKGKPRLPHCTIEWDCRRRSSALQIWMRCIHLQACYPGSKAVSVWNTFLSASSSLTPSLNPVTLGLLTNFSPFHTQLSYPFYLEILPWHLIFTLPSSGHSTCSAHT